MKKIHKLDILKIKNHSSAKDTIKKIKKQGRDCDKIFAKPISDKGLVCKIY